MLEAGIIALVALQVGDLVTTWLFLGQGKREKVSWNRKLIERYGFWSVIVFKIIVTGAAIAGVLFIPQLWWVLPVAIFAMVAVFLDNLMTLDVL